MLTRQRALRTLREPHGDRVGPRLATVFEPAFRPEPEIRIVPLPGTLTDKRVDVPRTVLTFATCGLPEPR